MGVSGSTNKSDKAVFADAEGSFEASEHDETTALLESGTRAPIRRCAILKIGGMTCSNCSAAVERALRTLDQVEKVEVDLVNEKATVQYQPTDSFDGKALCEEVDDIGFTAALLQDNEESVIEAGQAVLHLVDEKEPSKSSEFLRGLGGVLGVSESDNRMKVMYDPSAIGSRALLSMLRTAGHAPTYDPTGASAASVADAKKHEEALFHDLAMALFLTGFIVCICWVLPCFEHCQEMLRHEIVPGLRTMTLVMCALSTPVMILCGRRFHVGAWHSIKSGIWDMNVLISLGTGLAYIYSVIVVLFAVLAPRIFSFHHCKSPPTSYFEAPCMVISFLLVGKFLEAWAKQKTSQCLRDLLALQPAMANLLHSGQDSGKPEVVPAELLELGDVVQVYPGEAAPTDGIMVNDDAVAEFDESLLTGESRPVKKHKGKFIVGGSRCLTGRAELKVERLGSKTTLSQIASLMEKAQLSRAPVQQVADVIARIFVPCVVELACFTWAVWYVLVYQLELIPVEAIVGGSGHSMPGMAEEATTSEWPELDKFFFVLEHGDRKSVV